MATVAMPGPGHASSGYLWAYHVTEGADAVYGASNPRPSASESDAQPTGA